MTKLYGGIDLHANNSVIVLIDEQEQVVSETRMPNDLSNILFHLRPFQARIHGLVVESTYNPRNGCRNVVLLRDTLTGCG